MNNCMKLHATQDVHDEAREEWFALRIERQRERERKARVAQAQEDFMREWWGLPEHASMSAEGRAFSSLSCSAGSLLSAGQAKVGSDICACILQHGRSDVEANEQLRLASCR